MKIAPNPLVVQGNIEDVIAFNEGRPYKVSFTVVDRLPRFDQLVPGTISEPGHSDWSDSDEDELLPLTPRTMRKLRRG